MPSMARKKKLAALDEDDDDYELKAKMIRANAGLAAIEIELLC